MDLQRLDKLLAGTGKYSRKDAKALIRAGRVSVNGVTALSGEQKIGYNDVVTVDGKAILNKEHLYIMLNKPQGVLSATRDRTQPTALDLLPPELKRPGLFPAGRLDKDTVGFLLITDDGDLAHRILSPRNHIPKTYRARLDKAADIEMLTAQFEKGVDIGSGDITSPADITLLENSSQPLLEVVIYEGIYHQIKRMFSKFSYEVTWLERTKMGALQLDSTLDYGNCREILHKELELLR